MENLSQTAQDLLARMCTAHARDWGGVYVGYDGPDEAAYVELYKARLAKINYLLRNGIVASATAAGIDAAVAGSR